MAPARMLGLAALAATVVLAGCTSSPPSSSTPAATGGQTLGQKMAAFYDDQPFGGGQSTPEHQWFAQPDGTFLFLHYDKADPLQSDNVLWSGDAFPGKFCKGEAGVTQAEHDAGYVHFHKKSSPNWDAGHGGGPSYSKEQDGYWLRHISTQSGSMAMMGETMNLEEGKAFPMIPSDRIPDC